MKIPTTLKDMIKRLTAARRRKVEARAKELIAEELSRQPKPVTPPKAR